jgi:flagellar motor switch protein FliN/FliY
MSDFISSFKRLLSEIANGSINLGNFSKVDHLNTDRMEFVTLDLTIDEFGDGVIAISDELAKKLGNEMLKIFQLTVENLNDDLVLSTIGEAINQSVNGAIQENADQFGGVPSVSIGAAQVATLQNIEEIAKDKTVIVIEGGIWLLVPPMLGSILLNGHVEGQSVSGGKATLSSDSNREEGRNAEVNVEEISFPTLRPEPNPQPLPRNLELLLDVKVTISVELGRSQMSIKDLLSLGAGSIVTLDKLAGEPVDILVNGKPIAKGEVVVIDESFGVRILDIIAPKERLKAEV